MKYLLITVIAFTFTHGTIAQGLEKRYSAQIEASFYSLFGKDDMDFHISSSGKYLVMGTDEWIKILDESGVKMIDYSCLPKSNKGLGIASSFAEGATGGLISNVRLNEGTGFWLFENEGVIVLLDWNLTNNKLIGYDLSSGDKLWEKSEYRYTPGEDKQLASILASTVASSIAYETFSVGSIIASDVFRQIQYDVVNVEGYGSKRARAFITPIYNLGAFLLTNEKGISCLDIKTGEEKWTYAKRKIKIGDNLKVPGKNELILINNNPNFLNIGSGEKMLVKLNTETGEELFYAEHSAKFYPNRASIHGERLILDYWGAEIFDLSSGKVVFRTADEQAMKTRLALLPKEFVPPPVWHHNGNLIAGHIKLNGNRYPNLIYKKPDFSAYDLKTGEKLWTSDVKIKKTHTIKEVTDKQIILSRGALAKSVFMSLSTEKGKLVSDEVKIKQSLLPGNMDPLLFVTDNHIITHDGKKVMSFIDIATLKEEKDINTKDANVGKLLSMDVLTDKIILIGEKGVAFYSKSQGDLLSSHEIKNIESSIWNEDYLVTYTKDEMITFKVDTEQVIDTRPQADLIIASPNLKNWVLVDKKLDTQVALYDVK